MPRALDSIISQSYQEIEIVIVDDGSNDNTTEIIKEYQKRDARIRYFRHETNKGNAYARNTALRNSKGSYVAFMDDDDEWIDRDKLKKQLELFEKTDKNVAFLCSNVVIVAEDGTRIEKRVNRPRNLIKHILAQNGIIYNSSVMAKKFIMEEVGGFDEKMPRGIDSEFFRTSIVKYKYDVHFMQEITTAVHEYGDDRMTRLSDLRVAHKSLKANLYLLRKYKYEFIKNPFQALLRLMKLANRYKQVLRKIINDQLHSVSIIPSRKKKKNIKILVGSLTNKGDMMMFLSIIDKFGVANKCIVGFNRVPLSFAIDRNLFYSIDCSPQTHPPTIIPTLKRLVKSILNNFMPAFVLHPFRIVPSRNVDILLDASGYRYGDNWGVQKIEDSIRQYETFKNAKKIIMPQTLGPFSKIDVVMSFKKLINKADLVFSRDSVSSNHLKDIFPNHPNIFQAPDFTFDVESIKPERLNLPNDYVAIIPNHRLLIHGDKDTQSNYFEFLYNSIVLSKDYGYESVVIAHDVKHDSLLCEKIRQKVGEELLIYKEEDVRKIRWVIGNSKLAISSRFHGLINALTQGVPVIAMGWTHKFDCLLREYGCEKYLVSPGVKKDHLDKLLNDLFDESSRSIIVSTIESNRRRQKEKADAMWRDIGKLVEQD
ncbi:MAG: hypothetical protein VR65_22600 [Desulfobulbaceae bacterium BRH_c16a]|nr:MAG: hypothetical protein VR65_22600 [Desulfobulbaceae bacterium BRH_c16a]